MASTVIDSLVVLLGLDASNFKKGRETAEKETGETARKAKASADAITKSLTEVGRTIAGLFLGFESVSGFGKFLGNLNSGEAALGRTAANIGMGAHELNKWGNAAKLAGSDASDVQAAFTELTNDAQKFFVTGERSPLINTLYQFGVNIKDANGQLRNQGEVFEELADKTSVYGRQYQNFALKQAGITQGEINYLTQSKALRDDQLRLAERNNNVTDDSVAKAQELQEYWRNVGTQVEAAGQKILTSVTPAIKGAFAAASDLMDEFKQTGGLDTIAETMRVIGRIFGALGDSIQYWAKVVNDSAIGKYFDFMFKLYGKGLDLLDPGKNTTTPAAATAARSGATPGVVPSADTTGRYVPPAGSKAARFNNPGNILDQQGNERSYATPEKGAAALESDLRIKMQRGLKTVDAIITAYEGGDNVRNDIPAYIADVRKRLGKNELTEADIKQLARAIAIHESGPSARNTAAPVAGASTTVSVGQITVNAPNADPRAVADQVPAAIQRKFSVSQADTGQS
jgi:hypothetical protein